jgi:hypothetical protein
MYITKTIKRPSNTSAIKHTVHKITITTIKDPNRSATNSPWAAERIDNSTHNTRWRRRTWSSCRPPDRLATFDQQEPPLEEWYYWLTQLSNGEYICPLFGPIYFLSLNPGNTPVTSNKTCDWQVNPKYVKELYVTERLIGSILVTAFPGCNSWTSLGDFC